MIQFADMKTTCSNLNDILTTDDNTVDMRFIDENGKTYSRSLVIPRNEDGSLDSVTLSQMLVENLKEVHQQRQNGQLEFPQAS